MFMTGHRYKSTKGTHIEYREYLGSDWKASWEQAPIAIGGPHSTWHDFCVAIVQYYGAFVARSSMKKQFGFNVITDSLNTIYVSRYGKDAAKSAQETKEKIN